MNLKNKVLFVVVAAISSSCVSVRQGPIPGVAKNGEPIWVKQTTKHVSYKVKEKVGESVLKDSSGNVIATSDRYVDKVQTDTCLLYTSPSPRDATLSRMPSSA